MRFFDEEGRAVIFLTTEATDKLMKAVKPTILLKGTNANSEFAK